MAAAMDGCGLLESPMFNCGKGVPAPTLPLPNYPEPVNAPRDPPSPLPKGSIEGPGDMSDQAGTYHPLRPHLIGRTPRSGDTRAGFQTQYHFGHHPALQYIIMRHFHAIDSEDRMNRRPSGSNHIRPNHQDQGLHEHQPQPSHRFDRVSNMTESCMNVMNWATAGSYHVPSLTQHEGVDHCKATSM